MNPVENSPSLSSSSTQSRWNPFHYHVDQAGKVAVWWGLAVLVPFLVLLVLWSVLAPLNAAAIANAEVVLDDARKTVQHLEGGMVENILVNEAQQVVKGQALLVIRDMDQRTQINTLNDQLANARALNARLQAELNPSEPPDLSQVASGLTVDENVLARLKHTQLSLFQSRQATLHHKTQLIRAKQTQTEKEIEGLQIQLQATEKQLALSRQELDSLTQLHAKSFASLNQKIEQEKAVIGLEGQVGALMATIAQLQQSLLVADMEVLDLQHEQQNEILEQLQTNELNLQELNHQQQLSADALARTVVKAPVAGRVMDLQVHTQGAVVSPGQRLMDIVPGDDRLILEAKLNPNDIDLVKPGTQAKVMLSAYRAKKVPKLDGEVLSVSGDVMLDEANGERYFLVRVLVEQDILQQLKADVDLYPGMPVQVFFLAGERTLAHYLLAPVLDATYRAFREE